MTTRRRRTDYEQALSALERLAERQRSVSERAFAVAEKMAEKHRDVTRRAFDVYEEAQHQLDLTKQAIVLLKEQTFTLMPDSVVRMPVVVGLIGERSTADSAILQTVEKAKQDLENMAAEMDSDAKEDETQKAPAMSGGGVYPAPSPCPHPKTGIVAGWICCMVCNERV